MDYLEKHTPRTNIERAERIAAAELRTCQDLECVEDDCENRTTQMFVVHGDWDVPLCTSHLTREVLDRHYPPVQPITETVQVSPQDVGDAASVLGFDSITDR